MTATDGTATGGTPTGGAATEDTRAGGAAVLDLNADLGEGFGVWTLGDDEALLGVVSSANVACGFHAGDPATMRSVCAQAARLGVAVGAHVSYRDLAGFGRRFVDVDPGELRDDVVAQVGTLQTFARVTGAAVTHVKPHGALYNAIVHHERQAAAVAEGVAEVAPGTAVLGLPGSAWLAAAERAGLQPVVEAYADRGYTPAGTLVPRGRPGALVTDAAAVVARVVRLALDGTVEAVDGSSVAVRARSVCVHGDTPGAVAIATAVRAGLAAAGVHVGAFAPSP